MLLPRLAVRNVRRNLRRSLLTALTVLVAVALVTLALAWLDGIFGQVIGAVANSSGHIRLADPDWVAREELQPLYDYIPDTGRIEAELARVPGVVEVEPRIVAGATVTAGEEIGENFALVVGAGDRWFRERLHGPEHVASGRWMRAPTEAVIGATVARRIGAKPGDEILLLGQTVYGSMSPLKARVAGVLSADAQANAQVFVPLERMRWMLDMEGGALELLVYGQSTSPAVLGPLAERVAASPAARGLAVQTWYERPPFDTMRGVLSGTRSFIRLFFVFITALAIFNTMTMSVMERTGEIGVMRAMGLSRSGAVLLFVLEALIIGLLGGIGGAIAGSIPALYLEHHGVTIAVMEKMEAFPMSSTFYADLGPELVAGSVLLGLAIAVAGAILPALRAGSIQPVTAMRARR